MKVACTLVLLHEHLTNTFGAGGFEFDADYRHGSVWCGNGEIVRWNTEIEVFEWDDTALAQCTLVVDKARAEEHTSKR